MVFTPVWATTRKRKPSGTTEAISPLVECPSCLSTNSVKSLKGISTDFNQEYHLLASFFLDSPTWLVMGKVVLLKLCNVLHKLKSWMISNRKLTNKRWRKLRSLQIYKEAVKVVCWWWKRLLGQISFKHYYSLCQIDMQLALHAIGILYWWIL